MKTQNTIPAQHTPGPWKLRRFPHSGNNSTFVTDSTPDGANGTFRGQLIASMTTAPETLANLQLISAAPELLEVLHDIMDEAEFGDPSLEAKARAAIAKATGSL